MLILTKVRFYGILDCADKGKLREIVGHHEPFVVHGRELDVVHDKATDLNRS